MKHFFNIFLAFALVGCATGRGINKGQLNMYNYEQEKEIGKQFSEMVSREFAPLYDYEINAFVDNLGQKLVNVATDPLFEYQFRVFKSDMVNAFTVGGGYVFVTVGIIDASPQEAAFAGVVGHEIGHVLSRHVTERLTQQNLLGVATSAIGGGAAQAVDLFGGLGLLQFGRQNELEADGLGLELITKANYNFNGPREIFKVLKKLSENQATVPLLSDLLSTHPKPQDRIDRLDKLTANMKHKPKEITDTEAFKNIKIRAKKYISEKRSS